MRRLHPRPQRQQRLDEPLQADVHAEIDGRAHRQGGQGLGGVSARNERIGNCEGHDRQLPDPDGGGMLQHGTQIEQAGQGEET